MAVIEIAETFNRLQPNPQIGAWSVKRIRSFLAATIDLDMAWIRKR